MKLLWLVSLVSLVAARLGSHPKLHRALNGRALIDSYIVELDRTLVEDVQEVAEQLVGEEATIDAYYKHTIRGFHLMGASNDLVKKLLSSELVIKVEEDQEAVVMGTMNTDIGSAWGLDYLDWPMDSSYTWGWTGKDVEIFFVDTGIADNDDFGSRWECALDVFDLNCTDEFNHGTHTAGIAAGQYFGVAKRALIRAVKVMDKDGHGSMGTIMLGIDWVVERYKRLKDPPPYILNLSVGGGFSVGLNDSIEQAFKAGILVVGAAGNIYGEDSCGHSPSSSNYSITVGGIDDEEKISDFSGIGPCVDIWAPSTAIFAASNTGHNHVRANTGTSQAAPFVSGLAALYMQSGLTAAETKERIIADARKVKKLSKGGSPEAVAYSGAITQRYFEQYNQSAP